MALRRTRDEGIALILALLVLVILVVVILQMTASGLHNRTVAENHLSDLQNTYGGRAGYARALLYLQADADLAPEVDALSERWAAPFEFPLGKAQVRVSIVDSDRFVNLSQLVNDKGEVNDVVAAQLRRLVKSLHLTPDIADRIIDYIDADSKGEFEAKAKNGRLYNLEELLRIDGLTPEMVYGGVISGEERKGLAEFLTLWPKPAATDPAPAGTGAATSPPPPPPSGSSTPGVVNINTAPSEVLQALSDQMTPGLADAIVAYRQQTGTDGKPQIFQKVDDLKRVPSMSDAVFTSMAGQMSVKSSTFEIRTRGKVGNVEKAWVFVVRKSGGGGTPSTGTTPPPPPPSGSGTTPGSSQSSFTLIGTQALNDFFSVRPAEEGK